MAKVITIPIGPVYVGGGCRGIVHVIRQGDTLYKLGKQYHVSVSSIMYANPYVNIYNLQIGDELCIPVAAPRPLPAEPMPLPASPTVIPISRAPLPTGPVSPTEEVETETQQEEQEMTPPRTAEEEI